MIGFILSHSRESRTESHFLGTSQDWGGVHGPGYPGYIHRYLQIQIHIIHQADPVADGSIGVNIRPYRIVRNALSIRLITELLLSPFCVPQTMDVYCSVAWHPPSHIVSRSGQKPAEHKPAEGESVAAMTFVIVHPSQHFCIDISTL